MSSRDLLKGDALQIVEEQRKLPVLLPGIAGKFVELMGLSASIHEFSYERDKPFLKSLTDSTWTICVTTDTSRGEETALDTSKLVSVLTEENIEHATPDCDSKGRGHLGFGLKMVTFDIEDHLNLEPDDHVQFRGVISNSSQESLIEAHAVLIFRDRHLNRLSEETITIGRLPPGVSKEFTGWTRALAIRSYATIEPLVVDMARLR